MMHVEAVIKVLDPEYNLSRNTVKRRQANRWFKRGAIYRKALGVLRTAEQPLTARISRGRSLRPPISRPVTRLPPHRQVLPSTYCLAQPFNGLSFPQAWAVLCTVR
jgi:hypothetical protein